MTTIITGTFAKSLIITHKASAYLIKCIIHNHLLRMFTFTIIPVTQLSHFYINHAANKFTDGHNITTLDLLNRK